MEIGRIEKVPVRKLWAHEERGFTVWLEENLETLAEAVGIPLQPVDREKSVGSFRVDLVAETESGEPVIIENQLEPSNHDHLGKLVTYFSNLEATFAIWIVTDGRPEHVTAISWLNESTPVDRAFFLVRLEAIQIGNSAAAPLFTVLAGPSEEAKAIGQEKKELAERHLLRLRYWEGLLDRAKAMGILHHANRAPTRDSWLGSGAGRGGVSWVYLIWKKARAGVELYIDTGDAAENERILEAMREDRLKAEKTFGGPLDWQLIEGRRACRVRAEFACGGLMAPPEEWPEIQEQSIQNMDRLVGALGPILKKVTKI